MSSASSGRLWTAAIASIPLAHARACCAGVASASQPAHAYGGLSVGMSPSTRAMIQNGLPNHVSSGSNQWTAATGTSVASSARITWNWSSNVSSGNTW